MKQRKRKRKVVSGLWESAWGNQLSSPYVSDPNTRHGKLFRRRFHAPYSSRRRFHASYSLLRDYLVPQCRERQIFGVESHKTIIPVEFKSLVCLRILVTSDDITEVTGISES